MNGEVRQRIAPWEGVGVIALWYGEPHNCWRVEVASNDLDGDLANMTVQQAVALGRALISAAAAGVEETNPQ